MSAGVRILFSEEPGFKLLTEGRERLRRRYLLRQSVPDHWRQRRRGCRGHIPSNILVGGDVNGNIPTNIITYVRI